MTYPPRDRDREVIVTDRSSGAGVIVGVILAIVAVLLVVWLIFGMNGEGGDAEVVPDDVNVTVDVDNPAGGGEGGGEG
jgi:hypothetical protein